MHTTGGRNYSVEFNAAVGKLEVWMLMLLNLERMLTDEDQSFIRRAAQRHQ